jgi:hypothetical protein
MLKNNMALILGYPYCWAISANMLDVESSLKKAELERHILSIELFLVGRFSDREIWVMNI